MSNNLGVFLSDDGRTVVLLEGDREEQYTVDEFVEIYGEDALPGQKPVGDKVVITEDDVEQMAKKDEDSINAYYETIKSFLNAVGYHQGFLKVVDQYDNGTELEKNRAQEVIVEKRGVPLQFIDQELGQMNDTRWNLFRLLNKKAEALGLTPVESGKMAEIMKFLEEQPRRESLRNQIRTLQPRLELRSIDDLIKKRIKWEKIQNEKKGVRV